MSKKLNIGSGKCIRPGWINLDFIKFPGVNKIHNLNKFPYPFKDNEISEIFCSHILEHFSEISKIIFELYRICEDKAIIRIRVPHFSSFSYFTDVSHKTSFGYLSFDALLDDFIQEVKYNNQDSPLFKIKLRRLNFTRTKGKFLNKIFNPLINMFPMIYERFFCWIFPCSEVFFELEIIKDKKERKCILKGKGLLIQNEN